MWLTCPSLREAKAGTQDGNLEAGTEVETLDKCSLWLAQLSRTTQGHLSRASTAHSDMDSPISTLPYQPKSRKHSQTGSRMEHFLN